MRFDRRRIVVSRWLFAALCVVVMANAVITPILWAKIQNSRRESIRSSCEDQNVKHDKTLAVYDRVLLVRLSGVSVDAKTKPADVTRRLLVLTNRLPEDRRMQVEQARSSIAFLIQALAPHRDCAALVARLT